MILEKEDVVTVDIETFYDVGYSLSDKDMNMSEYVRHELFKVHCVAIKEGGGPVKVYKGSDEIRRALLGIDWKNKYLLAHNTAFDGFILSDRYGIHPKGYLDTLCMSRGLFGHHVTHHLDDVAKRLGVGSKIKGVLLKTKGLREIPPDIMVPFVEYCANDTELCHNIFWALYPGFFPDVELRLVDQTLKMFCQPKLLVDIPLVEKELKEEIEKKVAAIDKVNDRRIRDGKLPIVPGDLLSNKKFAAVLEEAGIKPPTKKSPTTGKSTYAFAKTDPLFQLYLDHEDERTREIFQARLAHKTTITETRSERFIKAGERGMSMPVLLNYYGAHTGRWSGGNKLNLQNLTRGGQLRRSLRAPRGSVVVVADSGQIEARTTAWLADETSILHGFKEKRDVYKEMASRIYGKPASVISDIERFVGKTCILGLGYGMGPAKLKATLALGINGPKVELSISECSDIVYIYRNANPKIVKLWRTMGYAIEDMAETRNGKYKAISWQGDIGGGAILLPNQMRLLYPALHQKDEGEFFYDTRYGHTHIYGGMATENVVQALSRIIIGDQMLAIGERYPVVTMSHDEIVWIAPESEAEESLAWGKAIMCTPPKWAADLPLKAEGGYDQCYSK